MLPLLAGAANAATHNDLCALASEYQDFARAFLKVRYNSKYKPLLLKTDQGVKLRLHKEYSTAGPANKMLALFVGPYAFKRMISRLATKLEMPPELRIHPAIAITYLEPWSDGKDPYDRHLEPPGSVEVEPNVAELEEQPGQDCEVEKIVTPRFSSRKKVPMKASLVRWKGFRPDRDEWIWEDCLPNDQRLVQQLLERNPRAGARRERPLHTVTESGLRPDNILMPADDHGLHSRESKTGLSKAHYCSVERAETASQ